MTIIRTLTVPLEIAIHGESIFLMEGGGKYTVPGSDEQLGFGIAGAKLVAYLPGHRAVSFHVEQLIEAGLAAIKADDNYCQCGHAFASHDDVEPGCTGLGQCAECKRARQLDQADAARARADEVDAQERNARDTHERTNEK